MALGVWTLARTETISALYIHVVGSMVGSGDTRPDPEGPHSTQTNKINFIIAVIETFFDCAHNKLQSHEKVFKKHQVT